MTLWRRWQAWRRWRVRRATPVATEAAVLAWLAPHLPKRTWGPLEIALGMDLPVAAVRRALGVLFARGLVDRVKTNYGAGFRLSAACRESMGEEEP